MITLRVFLTVLLALYFFSATAVFAAPSVASFNVSPPSGSSGYPFSFTWTLEDAGGSSLVVPCVDGIKAKNANTGTDIACGTELPSSAAASDGLLLKLINISGTSKTISVKLIPKDTSGVDQDAYASTKSVIIYPATQVVDFFKSSTAMTEIGKEVTLSWDIPDAVGANISMECKDFIRATSPGYSNGNLPCGRQIFDTALGKTATLTINFTNLSMNIIPVSFTIFPKIGTNVYNGINTESLTIDVASDFIPDPVVNYFKTSSPTTVLSGQNINLSWSTENTAGINLKISCADSVTATSSADLSSGLLCGQYAFSDLPESNGNISLAFQNKSIVSKDVTITLYPAFKNKDGYDATKSIGRTFEVKPIGSPSTAVSEPIAPTPTSSVVSTPTPKPSVKATPTPVSTLKPTPKPIATTIKTAPKITPMPTTEPPSAPEAVTSSKTVNNGVAETENTSKIKSTQEISDDLIGKKQVDVIKNIALSSVDNIYDVRGLRNARLFYFIPVKVKASFKVDAKSGAVKETHFAWWSFLVKWR